MNVRPKNYSWPDFYDHVVAVTRTPCPDVASAPVSRHRESAPDS